MYVCVSFIVAVYMYVCVSFIVAIYMYVYYALSTPIIIICILSYAHKGPWLVNKSILFYFIL